MYYQEDEVEGGLGEASVGGIEHNKVGQKCSVGKETDAWELEGVRELERGGSKWDIEAQHVLHSFTQSLVLQGAEISKCQCSSSNLNSFPDSGCQ